jgi:CubicO group peptidase (beta-lactamase class C family)
VKVRHLLALTSGLPESWGAPGFSAHEDYTAAELVALVAGMPLAFRPGERWDYCNTNYVLLAMLIEKASGEGYGDFLARRIFRPAGMTSTRVNDTRAVIPGRAVGYERGFGRWTLRDFIAPKLSANDGGALLSTANDLARWDRILWGGALLKVASRDRLWESSTLNDGTPTGFGFGWNVGQVGGRKAVWKSGGNPGYECHMLRFVDDRLTVIALCNLFPASTARLARAIAALYLPGVAEPEESPIEDTDPETTRAIRKALADSLEGDSNPGLFDAEQRDKLRSFGPLKEFALLGRNRDGDDLVHRYRVTLGDTTLIFNFKKPPGEKTQVAGVEFP